MLGLFLRLRGWDRERLGLVLQRHDAAIGVGLALSTYLAVIAIYAMASLALDVPGSNASRLVQPGITLPTAVCASIINAVFEEAFVAGYPIAMLKPSNGAAFAVNVSAAIRLSYHLYQGTTGALSVIPVGLIFGWWVARTGRLWPVIVAHALIDIVGLTVVAR